MADRTDTKNSSKENPAKDLPRNVLDHLLEGCQVIGPDFRYLYANEAAVQQGRTTRGKLLGRTMMETYPGIEGSEMFSRLRGCMEDRVPSRMENEFTFPDGSRGWFDLRFEPVPAGVAILSADITAQKHAETALWRSVRALTTLSQVNQSLGRAVDEHALIEDVCKIIVQSGGCRLAWIGLLDQEGTPRLRQVGRAGMDQEDEDFAREMVVDPAHRDGAPVRAIQAGRAIVERFASDALEPSPWRSSVLARGYAACLALPIRENESCIGVLTIYTSDEQAFDGADRDLLEEVALDLGYGIANLRARAARRWADAALEDERARTRAIYDHLPHPTLVWRRHAKGFTLQDVNQAAATATQGAAGTLLGSPARELASAVPHLAEDLARCFDRGTPIRREVECTLPGARVPCRLVLTYGFISPDMVLLHAEDVTEQRRTEEQLVAARRLEAIGRLAGGVAHDFNNLLSIILSYATFALTDLDASDPIRSDIQEVHDAGQRAAALIRQLLAFSRKQMLEPRVSNLNEVIGGLEGLLRRLLGEDIDIEIHPDRDLGNVVVDPGQIEQVIMNLTVNARDAMPRGGKLTIETANVELDEGYAEEHVSVKPGAYVRLSVADTGHGMDEHTRSRAFEPFFTTKDHGKGTGLGLSTVYGIVKQSGGNIWVYSEPGKGTIFKVYMPRVDAPLDRLEPRPMAPSTGNETILVVEDEDGVRNAAERILRGAGYHVLMAASGADALFQCDEHRGKIDLLLTDVVMPQMSGRELADQLKERFSELKVLFTSGYTDNAIIHHGVLGAGTRFISKPFSLAGLTRKVREVLDEPS